MDLNLTTQATLKLLARNTSPAIQNEIEAQLRASRVYSGPGGRVLIVDWTCEYSETTASFGLTTAGIVNVVGTAITPTLTVPHDDGNAAPVLAMKPLALDVFAITTPGADGQAGDGTVAITLNNTQPAILTYSALQLAASAPVAHMHWSADQASQFASVTFASIKQHRLRILAVLAGKA